MLRIFNDLEPFLKDNYQRISVRDYARRRKISPPSASSLLNKLQKEGLLKREDERNYHFFTANKDSYLFIHLSRIYWLIKLKNSGLINYLEKELVNPLVILFGSFSKAEVTPNSDVDIAILRAKSKKLNIEHFEQKLDRKIHMLFFNDLELAKRKELQNSILNGVIISGSW